MTPIQFETNGLTVPSHGIDPNQKYVLLIKSKE